MPRTVAMGILLDGSKGALAADAAHLMRHGAGEFRRAPGLRADGDDQDLADVEGVRVLQPVHLDERPPSARRSWAMAARYRPAHLVDAGGGDGVTVGVTAAWPWIGVGGYDDAPARRAAAR